MSDRMMVRCMRSENRGIDWFPRFCTFAGSFNSDTSESFSRERQTCCVETIEPSGPFLAARFLYRVFVRQILRTGPLALLHISIP